MADYARANGSYGCMTDGTNVSLTQTVELEPGDYTLTANVKAVNTGTVGEGQTAGTLSVVGYASADLPMTNAFESYTLDFTLEEATTVTVQLSSVSGVYVRLDCDDFTLSGEEKPQPEVENLLYNGDFEMGSLGGWTGTGSVEAGAAAEGSYGCLTSGTNVSVGQTLYLEPGEYQLSAMIRTVNVGLEPGTVEGTLSAVGLASVDLPMTNSFETYSLSFVLKQAREVTIQVATTPGMYARLDSDNFVLIKTGDVEAEQPVSSLSNMVPAVYPYYVDPAEYPDFDRRPYDAVTWEAMGGEPGESHLAAGRWYDLGYEFGVDGDVLRPGLGWIWPLRVSENALSQQLEEMAERGFILHNIGGYGPGSPYGQEYGNTAGFGEYFVTDEEIQAILDSGVVFTGFDIGEQDGRYNFTWQGYHAPYETDKVKQYINTQPFFDKVAETQQEYGSLLTVLWYWHYPIKENYTHIAGAETQNKITNSQVQYSFLRGAGKQYGVLWYGDVSLFDTWGVKGGWGSPLTTSGPSIGLLKREYFAQHLYNSAIQSFEEGWTNSDGSLTEIGQIHQDLSRFIQENGSPGVMQTPVALLNDFYSGWMPAKQIANKFVTWNNIPWDEGDYFFDGVLSWYTPSTKKAPSISMSTVPAPMPPTGKSPTTCSPMPPWRPCSSTA